MAFDVVLKGTVCWVLGLLESAYEQCPAYELSLPFVLKAVIRDLTSNRGYILLKWHAGVPI